VFRLYVSVFFLQVLDWDLVLLYDCWLFTGCDFCQSFYSGISLDAWGIVRMLVHRM